MYAFALAQNGGLYLSWAGLEWRSGWYSNEAGMRARIQQWQTLRENMQGHLMLRWTSAVHMLSGQ